MTSLTTTDEMVVLAHDARGRVRRTPEQRAALLAEFDRSGMSGSRFARHYGIKYQTLASWLQKRRRPANPAVPRSGTLALAEVVIGPTPTPAAAAGSGLRIELPGGATMHIQHPEEGVLAAAVLAALGSRGGGC